MATRKHEVERGGELARDGVERDRERGSTKQLAPSPTLATALWISGISWMAVGAPMPGPPCPPRATAPASSTGRGRR
jgi:hypothetical protein